MDTQKRDIAVRHLGDKGSALKKYQHTVTGSENFFHFLMFELIETLITPLPGKPGEFLRSIFFPFLFKTCSRKAKFGRDISLTRPQGIHIDQGVYIGDSVTLNIKGPQATIKIEKDSTIGERTILSCLGNKLHIGKETEIGQGCRLGSYEGLFIGQRCHIGNASYIIGAAHAFKDQDIPIIEQPVSCRGKTVIEDEVWIGNEVTIRDGVTIGKGASVAEGSLVLRDIEPGQHVAGAPATPIEEQP